jgi:hypothetical protein
MMEEPNNYLQMNKEMAPNHSKSTDEPMSDYLRMTSAEKREETNNTLPERPNFPPKLYPQLSVTNYINTSTEINTPPQTPLGYKNLAGHPPLSPTESLADTNYLAMLPAAQV